MATVNPVPTLSTNGWVTAEAPRLDYLMVYFFLTDKLQSTLYESYIASLPWILKENPKNMDTASDQVRQTLFTYLRPYYDSVDVTVNWAETDPTTSSTKVTLTIYATVTLNGITKSAGKILDVVDGKMVEFSDINNA